MSYAVITGASSGIGKQFAIQLHNQGYKLVLVARRYERLLELKKELGCECLIYTHNLANKDECNLLLEEIKDLDVEIFINNAGFGDFKAYNEIDEAKLTNMIDVNVTALSILTRGVLYQFLKANKGKIINVASSAGLLPAGPYMATYYATKSYVRSLTLAIAQELKDKKSNVYIGALCPGPVDTEFNRVADVEFSLKGITPEKCVKYTLKQVKRRKVIIVPTASLRFFIFLTRFVSVRFLVKVCGHQQKKKGL